MSTPRRPAPDAAMRAALDALDAAGLIDLCAVCRYAPAGRSHDQPTLCLACTEREIGLSSQENALRIVYGKTVAAWLRRDVDEPVPALPWKRWKQLTAHIPRRDPSIIPLALQSPQDRVRHALERAARRH